MYEIIINYATLIAFALFISDNLFQIHQLVKTKKSHEISLRGELLRVTAGTILVLKFVILEDLFLIIGQAVFTGSLFVYYFLLIKYKNN